MANVTLNVNGRPSTVDVPADMPLLWVLRDVLNLKGTKFGCGIGQCGACTVHLNGRAVRSCLTMASAANGGRVTTIEGLETNGKLHAVQEAFLAVDGFQCSYCASGMIMSAVALLKNNPSPSEDAIIKAMNRNICRCGTYPYIIKAIQLASKS